MATYGNMIPELLNAYNVYLEGELIGVSGETKLPELTAMTDSIELAGVMGQIDAPATGQFESSEFEIPFAELYGDVFLLTDTTRWHMLELRGSSQFMDRATGDTADLAVRITARGKMTSVDMGTFAKGKKTSPTLKVAWSYLKVEVDGETQLEIDKLNFRYILNGKDLMERIRKNI